jgi:hypothetical protein
MEVVKRNTEFLESLVDLQRQRQNLEKSLDTAQAAVTNVDLSGPNHKDTEEKEKLILLVQTQAAQIEAIKAEINNLIKKPISKTYVRVPSKHQSKIQSIEPPPLPNDIHNSETARELNEEAILEEPEHDSVALDGASIAAE